MKSNTERKNVGLKNEGLRVFGAWEPLSFRMRTCTDKPTCRMEDDYAWEHTEEFIKGLKERGFNLFITHFSKGRGITAETEEREDTRAIAQLCHKYGLHVGGYIRYDTFIPETFKLDYPDCVERMASVASKGMPRYDNQYWRYVPCPSSEEYLEYLDKLIGIGIDDIGLDCLHVDGVSLIHEPYACHCQKCQKAFRAWLVERYPTTKAQKTRFGFAPLDYVEIPDVTVREGIGHPSPIISDPVAQEWMFFRCQLLARIWTFIVNAAHRRNPNCYVQGNAGLWPNVNSMWVGAKDLSMLVESGNEGFFTEEGMPPELYPDGRLHGYFETFKKLRRLGIQTFTYNWDNDPERLKRAMAQQMAFNLDSSGVSLGANKRPGKWPVIVPEYIAFHRDRRDLFSGAVQAHDVAIYYSERNYALNSGTPLATQHLARDVMMRGHLPFGYLLADRRNEMSEFRAIVLPEVESMSNAEADDIAAYVHAGGGLLILGANTGRYDEFRRLHRENPLASSLGLLWNDESSAFSDRVGKGRVAFLPQLQSPDGTTEELVKAEVAKSEARYLVLYTELWRLPVNAAEMLQLLEWTAGGYCFNVLVPNTVVVEFVQQPEQKRHLIHLVNYDLDRDVGSFEIKCNIPVKSACAHTPDGDSPEVTLIDIGNGSKVIQIGGFHRYLIVEISLTKHGVFIPDIKGNGSIQYENKSG